MLARTAVAACARQLLQDQLDVSKLDGSKLVRTDGYRIQSNNSKPLTIQASLPLQNFDAYQPDFAR